MTNLKSFQRKREILPMVLRSGGPGLCQFALNNACNATCSFCNFARDKLPREHWEYVSREGALDAIDILYQQEIRYLVLTGGEATLHRNLVEIVQTATHRGMKVMLITNGSLLKPHKIRLLAEAGLSSFVISIDAASTDIHERNRGIPGLCDRIREANTTISGLGLHSTASVTMSRLVDYDALPDFLTEFGFSSVKFSYPLVELGSTYLGSCDSELVKQENHKLIQAFEKIKSMKKRFHVFNPTPSLEDMQRFIRNERQHFPCLGGFRFFYLDWKLLLWRCYYWKEPMCSIYEFDDSKRIRDGCTRCRVQPVARARLA